MSYEEEGSILDEEIAGTEAVWNLENGVVGRNLFVLTKDTDVVKRGDSVNTFLNLEEIIDINEISDIYNVIVFIDTELESNIFNRIAFFDTDLTIQRTLFTEADMNLTMSNGSFYEDSSVMIPAINGPTQKSYGTSFTLRADSLSSYREKGGYVEVYRWVLNDGTVVSGDSVVVDIPDDYNLIGDVWVFSCQAIDVLGNKSRISNFSMTIAEADYPVIDIVDWTINDVNPKILKSEWNYDEHIENNSYVLTITAFDPQDQDLTYSLICDDGSVEITQITDNVFNVTYLEYAEDTVVIFTVTVTNEDNLTDIESYSKTIINVVYAPVINNINWDDDNHAENLPYVMTIDAYDPQGQDLTYNVVANDINVTIVQDSGMNNRWYITYPNYLSDTIVSYTITATNEDMVSIDRSHSKLVNCLKVPPVINGLSWDNETHDEGETYELTIDATDPQGQNLTYAVVCDDANVTITQTGIPYIWTSIYPEYAIETIVTYTILITNEDEMTDTDTNIKTVHSLDPIINSYSWDDNNHEETGTYELTIDATDPQSQNLTYEVTCDDPTVTIVQTGTPNIWDVTYPDFVDPDPIINSYSWDNDNHEGTQTYELTIDATDPNSQDLTYEVTCDDPTVTIVQTGIPNIWDVTYPDFGPLGGDIGVFAGGYDNSDIIDYITISTTTNAAYFGDLTIGRSASAGFSNGINDRGIFAAGYNSGYQYHINIMDYITISTSTNATYFGDIIIVYSSYNFGRYGSGGTSNGTNERGIVAGGDYAAGFTDIIEYVTISTLGDTIDFGSLLISNVYMSGFSNGINERGVFIGGNSINNNIEYITINTIGDATDFGDLLVSRTTAGACSNNINERGVIAGGTGTGNTSLQSIEYVTINTPSVATVFGDLFHIRRRTAGTSNGTNERGIFIGGDGEASNNIIEYITINTTGDATDFGDLSMGRNTLTGTLSNA